MANSNVSKPAPGVTKSTYTNWYWLEGSLDALLKSGLVQAEWFQDGKTPFKGLCNGKQRIARSKYLTVDGRDIETVIDSKCIYARVRISHTPEEAAAIEIEEAKADINTQLTRKLAIGQQQRAAMWELIIERTPATFDVGDVAISDSIRGFVKITKPYGPHMVGDGEWRWGYVALASNDKEYFFPAGELLARNGANRHLKLVYPPPARKRRNDGAAPSFPRAS